MKNHNNKYFETQKPSRVSKNVQKQNAIKKSDYATGLFNNGNGSKKPDKNTNKPKPKENFFSQASRGLQDDTDFSLSSYFAPPQFWNRAKDQNYDYQNPFIHPYYENPEFSGLESQFWNSAKDKDSDYQNQDMSLPNKKIQYKDDGITPSFEKPYQDENGIWWWNGPQDYFSDEQNV
jgi:hypothetical protein